LKKLIAIFTEKPKGFATENQIYKFGFLTILLSLFFWTLSISLDSSNPYRDVNYESLIVPIMLLLNHISFSFKFSTTHTVMLRILAFSWLVFGALWFFFI
jgi:hypothetical protein